jgi:hypothetical protein
MVGYDNKPYKISFCITCKGRLDFLKETLPKNIADNSDYSNVEFFIIDYNCPQNTIGWIHENFPEEVKSGLIKCLKYEDAGDHFHFSHAKNMAHRGAAEFGKFAGQKNHILCNLDADNFTNIGFASHIAESYERKPNKVMFYDGLVGTIKGMKPVDQTKGYGIGGRLVYTKHDFYAVNGYNEHEFKSWGPDDGDIRTRMLKQTNFRFSLIPSDFLLGIPHSDECRYKYAPDIESKNRAKNILDEYNNSPPKNILEKLLFRAKNELYSLSNLSYKFSNFGAGTLYDIDGNKFEIEAYKKSEPEKTCFYK